MAAIMPQPHAPIYILDIMCIYGVVYFVHLHKTIHRGKRAEVLLLCHSFQDLNGPNTIKFPAKTKTVLGVFVFSEC